MEILDFLKLVAAKLNFAVKDDQVVTGILNGFEYDIYIDEQNRIVIHTAAKIIDCAEGAT